MTAGACLEQLLQAGLVHQDAGLLDVPQHLFATLSKLVQRSDVGWMSGQTDRHMLEGAERKQPHVCRT